MKEINIGKTILRLRKSKGVTQEQLANMIGVSAGAVSKWETKNSTPDISLLPPLARALDTSLNELLSFQEELTQADIAKVHQELTGIFLNCGFTDGELKCKEYLNQYPNSIGLKFTIASLLQMYSMLLGEDNNETINSKKQYALSLLYQVVDSKETKYSQTALFVIANIQMELENYEESEKCLKELSNSFIDPMVLYASLLQKQEKTQEAKNLCQGMLLQYLNETTAMMAILANISQKEKEFEKAVMYLETLNEIENTFKIGLYSGAYNLCRLYLKQENKELATKWFSRYIDGLISTEYDYSNNLYFENLKLQVNPEGQNIIRKKLYQSIINEPELKVLVGIPEYEKAVLKIKNEIDDRKTHN